jgi:diguanylate cyclase (GGDEF)-like protein
VDSVTFPGVRIPNQALEAIMTPPPAGSVEFINQPEWLRLRDALLAICGEPFSDYDSTLLRILSSTADNLNVARVGLWLFEPGREGIYCEALCENGAGVMQPGLNLPAATAPAYFAALATHVTLAADDAQRDPRTCEFSESYLQPNGIGAMLDVPVREFGHLVGVLCLEHIGGPRQWNDHERVFGAAMSALCSQSLEFQKLRVAESERQRALLFDPLTGLANRSLFLERLRRQLTHIPDGQDAAVVVADIDRFSLVLQAYGNAVGDDVLQQISRRIVEHLPEEQCARIGEDEFAVLITSPNPTTDALRAALQLQGAVARPLPVLDGDPLELSASVGVVAGLAGYGEADAVLRDALTTVAAAERQGRGGQEIFYPDLQQRAHRSMELERELRRAVNAGEFCFYLQPVFEAEQRRLFGAEALMRWQHPTLGLLSPDGFIPQLADAGLLPAVSMALLREFLPNVRHWRQREATKDFCLHVNFAPEQLAYPAFTYDLAEALHDAGLDGAALLGEITENTLFDRDGHLFPTLQGIADSGIALALDDFGTGYAALTHLVELPLSAFKIDRSFTTRCTSEPKIAAVMASLAEMARRLGLEVIAEGVETEEQLQALKEAGCRRAQGYLLGPPVPVQEFAARWLPSA